jgi:hypothetical protein
MPRTASTALSGAVEPVAGRGIIRASWIGTVVFAVTATASAIAPNTFIAAGVATAGLLFFAGIGVFFWAYAVAVNRSRTDLIGMGGLFFLAGSAPRPVQWSLLGSLTVEVVVGLATAAVHPFTPLAFGVLAPMYGLALCGLWAARYGTFQARPPEEKRGRSRSRSVAEPETGPKPTGRTTPKGSPGRTAATRGPKRKAATRTTRSVTAGGDKADKDDKRAPKGEGASSGKDPSKRRSTYL